MAAASIEELHDRLFGFVPDKRGTAYERLAAVVLAGLGWGGVEHDVRQAGAGRRATHQIDVVAWAPDGRARRLIVECKAWSDLVGKSVVDGLVGVRAQLGGDAAVVTTEGFTAGALRVAADEDIALIRLRPFDPNDGRAFITSMEVTLAMWGATVEGMSVHAPQATDDDLQSINRFPSEVLFVSRDGALIESLESVMRRNAYPMEEGDFPRAVAFEEDRYLALELGHRVPVTGVSWTWRVGVMRHTDVKEFEGEGMIVVEQLDDQGEVHDGRMIVDRELSAWTIDDHRQVRDIGRLDT